MRVVCLTYIKSPEFSEPQQWLHRLRGYFNFLYELAKHHEIISIEQINYEGEHLINGVRHVFFHSQKNKNYFPFALHREIRKLKPDVILVHGMHFPIQLIQLRMSVGGEVKILVQHHADKIPKLSRRLLFRLADRVTTAYLFAEASMANEWQQKKLITKRIKEVAVASSVFNLTDKQKARKHLKIPDKRVYLWVGRLEQNKDPLTAIEAFKTFSSNYSNAELFMIYQSEELLQEVKQASTGFKNIHLLEKRKHSELEYWFNSADFIISTSHKEAFGLAVVEGMSCGCIPILTDIPAFRKITAEGCCGFLFNAGNSNSLTEALQATSEMNIEEERVKTLNQFNNNFSFNAIAQNVHEVLLSV